MFPDGTEAVDGLDLEIADGEFMVLVGPSGSGKSTALRMVAGLEEAPRARSASATAVVNDVAPKDRDIAMVFQSYALYPHMTVADNIGLRAEDAAQASARRSRARVGAAAAAPRASSELLGAAAAQLSGGQRQRVALGRAIVREPRRS